MVQRAATKTQQRNQPPITKLGRQTEVVSQPPMTKLKKPMTKLKAVRQTEVVTAKKPTTDNEAGSTNG